MSGKPSSNLLAFASIGCLIVAAKFAPTASATPIFKTYGWIGAGLFGFSATVLAIQAIRAAEHRPSPFRAWHLRACWALRPRGFMVAWMLLITTAYTVGLPALAVEYPPRPCTYLTWNGLARSYRTECPWWIFVRPGARP